MHRCIRFKICHRKATIYGHSSNPTRTQYDLEFYSSKHESNPTLNDNEACFLAIVVTLPNVDSRISMLLLFILVPGKRMARVPLEHGYGAWENKDKVQNKDQKDSDHRDKNCIGGYHEDNNTTDKSRPWS
jgi:hypothetical protein